MDGCRPALVSPHTRGTGRVPEPCTLGKHDQGQGPRGVPRRLCKVRDASGEGGALLTMLGR